MATFKKTSHIPQKVFFFLPTVTDLDVNTDFYKDALCQAITEIRFVTVSMIKTWLKSHVLYKELCNSGI